MGGDRLEVQARDLVASSRPVELCVVGLGGTGLAAIQQALDLGIDVVGIDAGPVAGGAAGSNGGLFLAGLAAFHHDAVARHGRARAVACHLATRSEIDRIVADEPLAVRRTGSLRVAADDQEAADLQRMANQMQADGLPVAAASHRLGPAILFPRDASANPWQRCQQLATRAVRAGARVAEHLRAVEVSRNRVVTTTGVIRADAIVVAVDGRLSRLVPTLAPRVADMRLQMAATSPVSPMGTPPVYSRWGLDYWQQLPDGRVALGGGRDRGGHAERTTHRQPTDAVQAHLDTLASQVAPGATITHRWAAIVGWTATGLPVCEQVAPGLWALGGYCGTGNVIGSLLARAVVRRIAGVADDAADLIDLFTPPG